MGGSGKTPACGLVANRCRRVGRVAVASRSYRGSAKVTHKVHADWEYSGDEAVLLNLLTDDDVTIFAGPRLADVAAVAGRHADIVIVDSGLSTPGLRRTASVITLSDTPLNGIFPSGPLRQPLSTLDEGSIIWATDGTLAAGPVQPAIRSVRFISNVHCARDGALGLAWLQGRTVDVVCGIARPASFVRLLEQQGARVQNVLSCLDHRSPSRRRLAKFYGDRPVVTTAKDYVRWPAGFPVVRIDIELRIIEGQHVLEGLIEGAIDVL